jgi:hypothetical protein
MRAGHALLVLAVAFVSACAPERVQAPPGYQAPDRKLCKAEGGRIQRTLLPSVRVCVKPLADAGKPCSGSSDCSGSCIAVDTKISSLQRGDAAAGMCQAEDPLLGCFAILEGGTVANMICVD